MKKFVLLSIFSVSIFTAYCQQRKFAFGLHFTNGVSFMKSENKNIKNQKAGYSYSYGVIGTYYFIKNYGLSFGLNILSTRNSRINSPNIVSFYNNAVANSTAESLRLNPNQKEIYKLSFIDIPITLKLRTNAFGYFKFFGEFGVLNSFRIRARYTLSGSTLENEKLIKRDNQTNMKTNLYNISLRFGAGFEYTFSGNTALLVGIYFNNGFINMLQDGDDDKTFIRTLNFTTGILF